MIFVDTNVAMYAVGRPHPHRDAVRQRLRELAPGRLVTSSAVVQESSRSRPGVVQELLHAYLPVNRLDEFDAALQLLGDLAVIWPVTIEDARTARRFAGRHPALGARDLLHLAVRAARDVEELWTYDCGLAGAFRGRDG